MRHGFSLVELSIVLVILGLLTGGILAGQSLIRASELRAVVAELNNYTAAGHTFRDKYMGIPGDINNGTRFWNRQINQAWCVTNSSASVTTPGTCDGDGDGNVEQPAAVSQSGESFQFWKQLANAGMIEGSYTGIAGTVSIDSQTPGVNAPMSKLPQAGWFVYTERNFVGWAGEGFALDYGTYFSVDKWSGGVASASLKPEELWNIDTKLDDGKPGRGKIVAWHISTCTNSGSAAGSQNLLDSTYLLTSSSIGCVLIIRNVF